MSTVDNDSGDDRALTAMLAQSPLDDGGFTERMIAKLPARRRRRNLTRHAAIIGGAVAAGASGAAVVLSGTPSLAVPLGGLIPLAVVVAVALWGLVEGTSEAR